MTIRRVKIFSLFERFWHWSQMALIMVLLFSGFGLHGFHHLIGFETAVTLHTLSALLLLLLWVFGTFWLFTTRSWRHFIPTLSGMWKVFHFYSFGIFKGEHHPYRKAYWRKHNPLQRLTYLGILAFVGPLIWVTGWFYLFYDKWHEWGWDAFLSLEWVAFFHTAAAFLFLAFLIAHVYLITTGHTVGAHLKAMITGWEDVH